MRLAKVEQVTQSRLLPSGMENAHSAKGQQTQMPVSFRGGEEGAGLFEREVCVTMVANKYKLCGWNVFSLRVFSASLV